MIPLVLNLSKALALSAAITAALALPAWRLRRLHRHIRASRGLAETLPGTIAEVLAYLAIGPGIFATLAAVGLLVEASGVIEWLSAP